MAMASEPRPRPKLIARLELQRATHRQRHPLFRVAFGIAGALIALAGGIMLVTPGPAFVLIPVGLAMLSMEFVWAERLLGKSLEQAAIAHEKAVHTKRAQRIRAAIAVLLAIAACVLAVLWWDV